MVAARAATLQAGLDGDAGVKGKGKQAASPTFGAPSSSAAPPQSAAGARQPAENASPKKKARLNQHNVGDGVHTANRNGNQPCPTCSTTGACEGTWAPGGCTAGQHQCARCLSRDRGTNTCTRDPPAKGAGRGRGRGKGGRGKGR